MRGTSIIGASLFLGCIIALYADHVEDVVYEFPADVIGIPSLSYAALHGSK